MPQVMTIDDYLDALIDVATACRAMLPPQPYRHGAEYEHTVALIVHRVRPFVSETMLARADFHASP